MRLVNQNLEIVKDSESKKCALCEMPNKAKNKKCYFCNVDMV
jgi:hypothetical protein